MKSLVGSLLEQKGIYQIARFILVGSVTAFLDFCILYCCTEYFGINYLISSSLGFVFGSVSNYILSIIFVFEGGRFKSKTTEFLLFMFFTFAGLLLNIVLMFLLTDIIAINYLVSKIITIILITVFNFLTKKFFVFIK